MKGHVYKHGRTFRYVFSAGRDPLTGKRAQVAKGGFATEAEAWAACRKAIAEHDAGRLVRRSKQTVEQLINECLERRKHSIKPTMMANYRNYARSYVIPFIGHRVAQDLDTVTLDALYDKLLTAGRVKARREYRNRLEDKAVARKKAIDERAAGKRRRGPAPKPKPSLPAPTAGLSPKTVVNVHRMLHMVWGFGTKQGYLNRNVVTDANPPRVPRSARRTWTVEQLQKFLLEARKDRFFALWVLEATSGMRRGELAGARRDGLDHDDGTLSLWSTRVVVDGRVVESDGKSADSFRVISLDPYTLAALRVHLAMLDEEQATWGSDYQDHGLLFCWDDGRPPHPDTITTRFNRIVDAAGLPRIRLHDVRHSYTTAGRHARVDAKALSQRVGHSSVAFTMKAYMHDDLEADREVAHTLAALILAGLPAIRSEARGWTPVVTNVVTNGHENAPGEDPSEGVLPGSGGRI